MLDRLRQDPYIRALLALLLGLVMLDFLFAVLFGSANVTQRYISITYVFVQILAWVIIGGFFYGIYLLARDMIPPALKKLDSAMPKPPCCSQCKRTIRTAWACCPYCGSVETVESNKA